MLFWEQKRVVQEILQNAAGNEFLFQMQALTNIEVINAYGIKKVVTACPHCFNTLKNEYPELGGDYEVVHHTQFLKQLLDEKKIGLEGGQFRGSESLITIRATSEELMVFLKHPGN